MNTKVVPIPTPRDRAGLRELIYSEIDLVRAGKTSPSRLNAMAKAATIAFEFELDMRQSP